MLRNLRVWLLRLAGSVRGAHGDGELSDELASHLQLHIDDNLRAGMSPEEARRQALLKLGGVDQTKEAHRDRRGFPWLDALGRDVKYAIRFLRRSPGFTTVAVLSLALGIGANTAIFSLVDSLLLRSLPVRQPDRLVQLSVAGNRTSWTNPLWEQIRDRPGLFQGSCAWFSVRFNLAVGGEAHYVSGLFVSGDFFQVLGVTPVLGRGITRSDDRRGGGVDGQVAVISYRFWQTQFAGQTSVLGRTLSINGSPFTIVGVAPAGFYGLTAGSRFDVAVPVDAQPVVMGRDILSARSAWWLNIVARLKPEQTIASASAALHTAQPAIREATLPKASYRPDSLVRYLKEPFVVRSAATGSDSMLRNRYETPLLTLMGVVGLILLVACVNLANLLLVRADARRHELSVRLALGVSRARLMGQLLVESLLLSCSGAIIGVLLAHWGSRLLVNQLPAPSTPIYLDLSPDSFVLAFTVVILVAVTLLFGMAPALRATGGRPTDTLAERAHEVSGPVRWRLTAVLMVVQIASCLVLVVGAGLFVRTFASLATRPLGFTPGSVLIANLESLVPDGPTAIPVERVVEAVRAVPGVQSAAVSALVPLGHMQWDETIENPRGLSLSEDQRDVWMNAVSPGWFGTLGTGFVAGRDFGREDATGAPPVAIVNEAFVRRYFPRRQPLRQSVRLLSRPGSPQPLLRIVGVVRDAVYDTQRERLPPTLYRPMAQAGSDSAEPTLVVRASSANPTAIVREVASAISRVDPHVTFTFRTMSDLAAESLAAERIMAMLSGFFGALALLLAAIGLYGVVSYTVNRRRTEIGIRMALGARPGGIVRMVLGRIGLVMAIGLAIGAIASVWLAQFVRSLLFGLQPNDPITLAGAVAVLAAVGLLASWLPARRAARIDPMEALRDN